MKPPRGRLHLLRKGGGCEIVLTITDVMSAGVLYYSFFFSPYVFVFQPCIERISVDRGGNTYDRTLALNTLLLHAFQGDESTLQTLVFTYMAYDRQGSRPRHRGTPWQAAARWGFERRHRLVAGKCCRQCGRPLHPRFGRRWNYLVHI